MFRAIYTQYVLFYNAISNIPFALFHIVACNTSFVLVHNFAHITQYVLFHIVACNASYVLFHNVALNTPYILFHNVHTRNLRYSARDRVEIWRVNDYGFKQM